MTLRGIIKPSSDPVTLSVDVYPCFRKGDLDTVFQAKEDMIISFQ